MLTFIKHLFCTRPYGTCNLLQLGQVWQRGFPDEYVGNKASGELGTHPMAPSRWWGGGLNPGLSVTHLLWQNADSFTLGLAGTQNSSLLFTEYVYIRQVSYMLNLVS